MLSIKCINPEIISALALCGHGDKVLIADGNYPLDSKTGDSKKVYLGLTPGTPTVTQTLEAILSCTAVERAEVMQPDDGTQPQIFEEFTNLLDGMELDRLGRWEFYDECCKPTVRLSISTGEKRTYANILLTIGVS